MLIAQKRRNILVVKHKSVDISSAFWRGFGSYPSKALDVAPLIWLLVSYTVMREF
jgi:hypothetical protein